VEASLGARSGRAARPRAAAAFWLALREQGVPLNELTRRLGRDSTRQALRLLDPRIPRVWS
jgi:hypothetical protein